MFRLLSEITENEKDNVGLKAYNCSRLLKLGVNTKEGFVIFGSFEKTDIKLIEQYAKENILYAVRSSMGDEDGTESSNAGRYESVLGAKKENLIDEIEYVMESAGDCKERAVLIQELVISEAAGVIFSINPVYKTETMLINACLGAGENVVSSLMEADTYEVGEDKIKSCPKERRVVFSYGIDSYPGEHMLLNGIEVRTVISNDYKTIHSVFYEGAKEPVLKEKQIKELYMIAKQLREIFDEELDIEFAIEREDVYILQVRPITAISQIERTEPEELAEGALQGQVVSKGEFSGEAVFVDIAHLEYIEMKRGLYKDKILVVYELVPELVYCLDGVVAILTAKGGVLSHGAIMAREKGIPCISDLGEKIHGIKTGTILKVNADRGEIYIGEGSC